MSFQVGQIVGDYRIVGVVGSGGMGDVYQAEHIITRRLEALKVLTNTHSGVHSNRFLREIQVQASLRHPNIAEVHSAFHIGSDLALVMELLDGSSLAKILTTKRVSLQTALGFADQVLSALDYAHSRGVIHRDVAPSNIIVTPSGEIRLTDFGLAKRMTDTNVSQSGEFVGSPHYMSPEQAKGNVRADGRSDIYSTGAVLYELVTGHKLFDGPSVFDILSAQVHNEPVRPLDLAPDLPRALNNIILKAVAKDPEARFQSADEFRNALRTSAAAPRAVRRPGRISVRQLLLGSASALTVIALAAGIWWYLGSSSTATATPRPIPHAGPAPVEKPLPKPVPQQEPEQVQQPVSQPPQEQRVQHTTPSHAGRSTTNTEQSPVWSNVSKPAPQTPTPAPRETPPVPVASHDVPSSPNPSVKPSVKKDEVPPPEPPPLIKAQPGKVRSAFGKILHPLTKSRPGAADKPDSEKP